MSTETVGYPERRRQLQQIGAEARRTAEDAENGTSYLNWLWGRSGAGIKNRETKGMTRI
jgi:hypothetical protein